MTSVKIPVRIVEGKTYPVVTKFGIKEVLAEDIHRYKLCNNAIYYTRLEEFTLFHSYAIRF